MCSYRPELTDEIALKLMEKDGGTGLMPECLDALIDSLDSGFKIAEREAA